MIRGRERRLPPPHCLTVLRRLQCTSAMRTVTLQYGCDWQCGPWNQRAKGSNVLQGADQLSLLTIAERMNRIDLQVLSETRLSDAIVLLGASRWAAAYYLFGYAIECGLKACAVRQFRQDEVPDKTIVNDFYTHRLDKLLGIAGIKAALEDRTGRDAAFQISWNTVRDWNETSRYDHAISEVKARDMHFAVADPASGVLTWLRTQW